MWFSADFLLAFCWSRNSLRFASSLKLTSRSSTRLLEPEPTSTLPLTLVLGMKTAPSIFFCILSPHWYFGSLRMSGMGLPCLRKRSRILAARASRVLASTKARSSHLSLFSPLEGSSRFFLLLMGWLLVSMSKRRAYSLRAVLCSSALSRRVLSFVSSVNFTRPSAMPCLSTRFLLRSLSPTLSAVTFFILRRIWLSFEALFFCFSKLAL